MTSGTALYIIVVDVKEAGCMKSFSEQLLGPTKKWIIPGFGVLALIIFTSLILFEATKATIDVTQNGKKETVMTHSKTVGTLLDELEISLGAHDDISHDVDTSLEDGMEIVLDQAKQIYVTVNKDEQEFYTTTDTIGDFLAEENLEFSKYDDVSFHPQDAIVAGMSLSVDTAYQVTVNDAGENIKVWTTGGSIGDLLDENNIELSKADKVKPAIDKKLKEDTDIKITRVETDTDEIKESIAFDIEEKEDSTLTEGKEEIISEGKKGILIKKYEITKENGKEVKRELLDEQIERDSQKRIVAVGTKQAEQPKETESNLVTLAKESDQQTKSSNTNTAKKTETKSESNTETKPKKSSNNSSSSSSDGKVLSMTASAYSADCSGCSGVTATGINLKSKENRNIKIIAVDPNVIPLGTKVWVEGYGNAVAGDTGGGIQGNRIDVYFSSQADAMGYGLKKVDVKILD